MKLKIKKILFLIDAYALIFRSYYAFIKNPCINSKGLNTSVIMGFTNFIIDLIIKQKLKYMAVVFDIGPSIIRKKYYPQYKIHRKKTPEVICSSIPYIYNILKALNISIFYSKGYEADDVIGTLAKKAEKNNYITYIVSFDKDFYQLVTNYIKIYKPIFKKNISEILGINEVCLKYEIKFPIQLIDFLGMMGDPVDNIPGLPGVGKKTAKKFIHHYGSLENLLDHSYEIKGKLREKIEKNKELGLISKKLATIITNVPLKWNEKKLLIKVPNKEKVQKIFKDLEFKKLLNKFYNIFYKYSLLTLSNHKLSYLIFFYYINLYILYIIN